VSEPNECLQSPTHSLFDGRAPAQTVVAQLEDEGSMTAQDRGRRARRRRPLGVRVMGRREPGSQVPIGSPLPSGEGWGEGLKCGDLFYYRFGLAADLE
jgi:hypothetical protein